MRSATASPTIKPRSAWADGIADAPGLAQERPGDVRMLLVHHSETSNSYRPDAVAGQIRSFHRYHTTTKGWPDVAYSFFADRHGGLWEGRTGSLSGPVIGDATGGNQGFSQLCCFIGSHTTEAPTAEAQDAMVSLLAWLSIRYEIDALGRTSFTSRGSNRWPAGSTVETATIEGHRAMSQTTCPGDAAYPLVVGPFRQLVAGLVAPSSPSPATSSTTPVSSAAPTVVVPASTTTAMLPGTAPSVPAGAPGVAITAPADGPAGGGSSDDHGGLGRTAQVGIGAGVLTGGAIAAAAVTRSRRRSDPTPRRGRPGASHPVDEVDSGAGRSGQSPPV